MIKRGRTFHRVAGHRIVDESSEARIVHEDKGHRIFDDSSDDDDVDDDEGTTSNTIHSLLNGATDPHDLDHSEDNSALVRSAARQLQQQLRSLHHPQAAPHDHQDVAAATGRLRRMSDWLVTFHEQGSTHPAAAAPSDIGDLLSGATDPHELEHNEDSAAIVRSAARQLKLHLQSPAPSAVSPPHEHHEHHREVAAATGRLRRMSDWLVTFQNGQGGGPGAADGAPTRRGTQQRADRRRRLLAHAGGGGGTHAGGGDLAGDGDGDGDGGSVSSVSDDDGGHRDDRLPSDQDLREALRLFDAQQADEVATAQQQALQLLPPDVLRRALEDFDRAQAAEVSVAHQARSPVTREAGGVLPAVSPAAAAAAAAVAAEVASTPEKAEEQARVVTEARELLRMHEQEAARLRVILGYTPDQQQLQQHQQLLYRQVPSPVPQPPIAQTPQQLLPQYQHQQSPAQQQPSQPSPAKTEGNNTGSRRSSISFGMAGKIKVKGKQLSVPISQRYDNLDTRFRLPPKSASVTRVPTHTDGDENDHLALHGGDVVKVKEHGSFLEFEATVVDVHPENKTADVIFVGTTDIEKAVAFSRLNKVRSWSTLEPGDSVEVREEGTRLTFQGTVATVNEDGTYDVAFDGDETERAVPEARIRKVKSHRFSASQAVGTLAHVLDVGMKLLFKQKQHHKQQEQQQQQALEEKKAKQEEETKAANEKKASTRRRFGDTEQKRKQPPTPSRKQQLADEIVLQNEWLAMRGGGQQQQQQKQANAQPVPPVAVAAEDEPREHRSVFIFDDSDSEHGDGGGGGGASARDEMEELLFEQSMDLEEQLRREWLGQTQQQQEEEEAGEDRLEEELRREWVQTQHELAAGPTEHDVDVYGAAGGGGDQALPAMFLPHDVLGGAEADDGGDDFVDPGTADVERELAAHELQQELAGLRALNAELQVKSEALQAWQEDAHEEVAAAEEARAASGLNRACGLLQSPIVLVFLVGVVVVALLALQ